MAGYVDKNQVQVRIARAGLEPMEGSLSLQPAGAGRPTPETLLELLNGSARVIPFTRADRTALLLGRLALDWVAAGPEVPADLVRPQPQGVTRGEKVRVRFLDGKSIEGQIQMDLSESRHRISDFLNGTEDYFVLATRLGTLLVNKARVGDLLAFESSPLPLPRPHEAA